MFLKTLQIKGFKSFADKTELVFEPGVTVDVFVNVYGDVDSLHGVRQLDRCQFAIHGGVFAAASLRWNASSPAAPRRPCSSPPPTPTPSPRAAPPARARDGG